MNVHSYLGIENLAPVSTDMQLHFTHRSLWQLNEVTIAMCYLKYLKALLGDRLLSSETSDHQSCNNLSD